MVRQPQGECHVPQQLPLAFLGVSGLGLSVVFFWLWPHTATGQAPAGSPSHSGGGRDARSPSSILTIGLVMAAA